MKNKNEYSNVTKIIGEIYQEFVELIKNLLVLNPKKRMSAKQVLMSKYLDCKLFKNIDSFDIKQIQKTGGMETARNLLFCDVKYFLLADVLSFRWNCNINACDSSTTSEASRR